MSKSNGVGKTASIKVIEYDSCHLYREREREREKERKVKLYN